MATRSSTFNTRLCAALGIEQAGSRSARLAVLAYRMGLRTGALRLAGRSCGHLHRRLPAINAAYLAALATEREQALL